MLKKKNLITFSNLLGFIFCALIFATEINAQEFRVIDNKGTFITVNNNSVTTSTTEPVNPIENDVWFDSSVTPNVASIWDGNEWLLLAPETATDETVTTFIQNTTTGEITYTDENETDSTAQVISADPDNQITVGSDGGAFFSSSIPTICAAGKVASAGGGSFYNATATLIDTGDYNIQFDDDLGTEEYVIQLTVTDLQGAGNDDPDISYYAQTSSGFSVNIGDNDNGAGDRTDVNSEFMFNVICLPGFGNAVSTGGGTTGGGNTGGGGTTGGGTTDPTEPTLPSADAFLSINTFSDILVDGFNGIAINYNDSFDVAALTEVQVQITDVPYSDITNFSATIDTGDVSNVMFTLNSEPNDTNTGFNHLITVSNITFPVFRNLRIFFTPSSNGTQNCSGNNCNGINLFSNQ